MATRLQLAVNSLFDSERPNRRQGVDNLFLTRSVPVGVIYGKPGQGREDSGREGRWAAQGSGMRPVQGCHSVLCCCPLGLPIRTLFPGT